MNFAYAQGREIDRGEFSSLGSFLRLRNVSLIETAPDRLSIVTDGITPILRVVEKTVRDYPLRESFIGQLLKWHRLGRAPLRHASNETAVSFFNDLLLAISGDAVRVQLEDGEATAITTVLRSVENCEADVAEACTDLAISAVSRTDRVLRLDSAGTTGFQPRAGEDCRWGFSVIAEAPEFRALEVSHFITHDDGTTGVVIRGPAPRGRERPNAHASAGADALREHIHDLLRHLELTREEVERALIRAASNPPSRLLRKRAAAVLRSAAGAPCAVRASIDTAATEWDLAAIVTSQARHLRVEPRLVVERWAGDLLCGANTKR